METIKVECRSCKTTGLYVGFAEPAGVAVICLDCNGTGCREIKYTPFTSRKTRNTGKPIHTIRRSCGSFMMTGIGITFQEFQQGKMPQ